VIDMTTSPILCDSIETDLGLFLLARSSGGLCFLGLRPGSAMESLRSWRDRWEPEAQIISDSKALAEEKRQLEEFARGARSGFELELDLRGTSFQLGVWNELREIPSGSTRTYGEIAARLGMPGASRAVGAANGANPVPIVVPCHRVVSSSGIGGFGGGLDLKRALLELEGVLLCS
jgi:O-6-methylguanine DNA methyltransferase